MDLQIRRTDDGSITLFSEMFQECYHSSGGAVKESMHVFINAGLTTLSKSQMNIFEVGFGTGLNALLTLLEAQKHDLTIEYTAIELYPVEKTIVEKLVYAPFLKTENSLFQSLHQSPWNERTQIIPNFFLRKIYGNLTTASLEEKYDLVYFDAFSPAIQPELWTDEVFAKMFNAMSKGGLLTTYCAKGAVRRAMQKAGFLVERLPGPPPKREMLRARKTD